MYFSAEASFLLHSVLWRCWLGNRKGIRPGCWSVNGEKLTGALHVLYLQLPPPPPPSSLLQYNPEWWHSGTSLPGLSWKIAMWLSCCDASSVLLHLVFWNCWLGDRKGMQPVKSPIPEISKGSCLVDLWGTSPNLEYFQTSKPVKQKLKILDLVFFMSVFLCFVRFDLSYI